MRDFSLLDNYCRVRQAQAVLSLWLASMVQESTEVDLVASVLTLLDGVPEAIDEADGELERYALKEQKEGKA
jgi:hypothetical protein